jgi:hypothetical protein
LPSDLAQPIYAAIITAGENRCRCGVIPWRDAERRRAVAGPILGDARVASTLSAEIMHFMRSI